LYRHLNYRNTFLDHITAHIQPAKMPIKNYGVWKATPTSFRAERNAEDPRSPHGYLNFKDGVSTKSLSSAINVKSTSSDSRLVYWLMQDVKHALRGKLAALDMGWHDVQRGDRGPPDGVALDLLRSGIVEVGAGRLLPHDVPGGGNDIVDFLEPFFMNAIQKAATVYLYGEQYSGRDGVHDVHMNQGSSGGFSSQNGVYQDGGILLEYPDGHWEAFLIAFASQAVKTNDKTGNAEGPEFGEFLDKPGSEQPPSQQPGGGDDDDGSAEPAPGSGGGDGGNGGGQAVFIEAALVNPDGPDGGDNAEVVYLVNPGPEKVLLEGWKLENHMGMSGSLPAGSWLAAKGGKQGFTVAGVPLSNKGGSIRLRDAEGRAVDEVEYTKKQASQSGQLVYFKGRR
jgi:uncharacterized protein YukJ